MRLSCMSGDRLSRRMNRLSTNRGNPGPRCEKLKRMVGAAEPVLAGQSDEQPPLGFEAHELVVDLWAALGSSVEGQFYSAADWQRARWELWYANAVMTAGQVPSANMWTSIQRGLDELLVVRR